jgi:hypothetical protein
MSVALTTEDRALLRDEALMELTDVSDLLALADRDPHAAAVLLALRWMPACSLLLKIGLIDGGVPVEQVRLSGSERDWMARRQAEAIAFLESEPDGLPFVALVEQVLGRVSS